MILKTLAVGIILGSFIIGTYKIEKDWNDDHDYLLPFGIGVIAVTVLVSLLMFVASLF